MSKYTTDQLGRLYNSEMTKSHRIIANQMLDHGGMQEKREIAAATGCSVSTVDTAISIFQHMDSVFVVKKEQHPDDKRKVTLGLELAGG
ncbi:MAG: winged helix-turn-helix transcriptional regulator [Magnetococcales bacterium]|nr:winged helix-turn-helix transcriptional regulator [Magnetococcales bacterium]